MLSRRRDPGAALADALLARSAPAELLSMRSVPWTSATFDGCRHELILLLTGEDSVRRAHCQQHALPDAEFALRGHIVADIAACVPVAAERGTELRIEALTIEDA